METTDTQTEVQRLRAVLAYYAAHETWWLVQTEDGRGISADNDKGARARAALAPPTGEGAQGEAT